MIAQTRGSVRPTPKSLSVIAYLIIASTVAMIIFNGIELNTIETNWHKKNGTALLLGAQMRGYDYDTLASRNPEIPRRPAPFIRWYAAVVTLGITNIVMWVLLLHKRKNWARWSIVGILGFIIVTAIIAMPLSNTFVPSAIQVVICGLLIWYLVYSNWLLD